MTQIVLTVFDFLGILGTPPFTISGKVETDIGAGQSGVLEDDDGMLGNDDDGISTFNGFPIDYIGHGTLKFDGPTGTQTVQVAMFEAGGQTVMYFPGFPPDLTPGGSYTLSISSTDPFPIFTPPCFAEGTKIRTPFADVPIESLSAGDWVITPQRKIHQIKWIGSFDMTIPVGLSDVFEKRLPVRIEADALGKGKPYDTLYLSQQHRVMLDGLDVSMMTGHDAALAPAVLLTEANNGVNIDRSVRRIRYYHILCSEHVVLVANGLPCESLLPGEVALNGFDEKTWEEILEACPELGDPERRKAYLPVKPVLKSFEVRALRRRKRPIGYYSTKARKANIFRELEHARQ